LLLFFNYILIDYLDIVYHLLHRILNKDITSIIAFNLKGRPINGLSLCLEAPLSFKISATETKADELKGNLAQI
jgi:hypothetical protein